ncbi:calcium-binding tyrosine phosphorylation-regulated protein-like isoform X2 [Heptranchias perlo]|uniref:calcium-binding tyrosine phosphorylation-regulated protein-like isoform X2 n=1 Tax=Heptranchias perlo TaxID=212740 RepID=UPI003559B138
MSVPFSNTTLRIPRGFGNLLEGLSREVLRRQPEDIIGFAAMYFEDLLARRMASGIDPADWAAQLEDRFYNNHIFKEKRTTTPEDKAPPETIDTAYKEKDVDAIITGMSESREGTQKKCVKKPMHFTSISKMTISMMLEDAEIDALSPKEAPAEGAVDETAVPMTEEPAEAPKEVTAPLMIEAAPAETPKEVTAPLMIEAAPGEGPKEDTAPLMIETAQAEAPKEDTAPLMVEAAPEEGPKEDTAPLMVEAAPEEGPKEDTASVTIEAVATGEEIEQIQTPEEPLVLEKQEDTTSSNKEQAAVIIQATYRGYRTRKKLKDEMSSSPDQAENELFTEDYPGTDGSEYSSGEELTFAEEDNVSFAEALGVSHEEPKSRMEGNVSTTKVDTAPVNICATELGSPLEKENFQAFNTDVDICGAELQTDTTEDNKSEPNIDTETAGHDICGTELDQKNLFEATFSCTANVDISGTELEGFVAGKDTGNETSEDTKIDIELQGEPGDEIIEEAVHHYEAGVSGTVEDSEGQVDESQKNTEDIKEESKLMAYTKDNDNPPTEENLDAEGDSSMKQVQPVVLDLLLPFFSELAPHPPP